MEIPEVDLAGRFDLATAREKSSPAQLPLIEELAKHLG
jgi:predicted NUDIX family NTP pyrophosphohydrolase